MTQVSCAADAETVKARVAEGWQNIRIAPGYTVPGQADPNLFEPRVAIATSIANFTAVRRAVGPSPTLGTDFHTRLCAIVTISVCHAPHAHTVG
jgi:L-alanine-DL-glutamate epimerase-like enolase superfamily enzyme